MHSSLAPVLLALAALLGPVLTYLGMRRSTAVEREKAREALASAAEQARGRLALEARAAEQHAADSLHEELRKDLERGRSELTSLRSEIATLRNEVVRYREELILERENSSRLRALLAAVSTVVDTCPADGPCPVRASGLLPTREADQTARHRILTPPLGIPVPVPKPPEKED